MRQAVDLKSAEGQYEYGNLLINEVDKDGFQDTNSFPAAATWFQKAAAQGAAKAQYQLAEMYHTGKLGDDQRSNCVAWFLKAAAQGYVEAQAQIGTLPQFYPNSELLKSADPIDMLQKAAAQDNLDSEFDLAFRYHKGDGVPKDPALAFHWMEKAAQHDISPVTRTIDSHYYLGLMYETGEGVATNLVKAFQLYQAAAVAGNKPDPFFHLARMYETGAGGIQDDRQAAENYYQATQFGFFPGSDDTARRGSIEGLANLYAQGRGMPGDKTIAARQVNELKAGSLLTAKTYFLLGEMYAQGRPVSPDLAEAAAWLRLASLQKVAGAAGELEKVQAEMSPAQNSTAQRRFDDLNRTMRVAIYAYGQAANYRDSHSW
jgi:TPR repeat protein